MSDAMHTLSRETEAAKMLLAHHADVLGDDDAKAIAVETETTLHDAIGRALSRIRDCDLMADAIASHVDALKQRKERIARQSEALRTAVGVAMDVAQLTKVEHALGTVSVRAVPPKVQIIDEAAVPARFWKPSDPKLDKKAVLDAIKQGEDVPGATLSNGSTTIAVKV